jgi:hypothetical protein
MIYLSAQPATQYFGWQIDVMLHSFVTVGVNLENVHIVGAVHGEIDKYFTKLMEKYPGVIFSFYEDTREDKTYISSIRPHVLKKHFAAYKDLSKEVIFYHDCDIVFTKPLDTSKMLEDDICYLSDTVSYIGHNYIQSKGEDVLDLMCEIVGIDKKTVKENQENSGGAQYLMKGIDKYFWYDVEKDSTNLFKRVSELNKIKKDPNYHEIQIWCADMWAVLWNLWKRNKETRVVDELNFSWSNTNKKQWHINAIYHNAGVVKDSDGMFYKGKYVKEMPLLNLELNPSLCSYNYYQILKQVINE